MRHTHTRPSIHHPPNHPPPLLNQTQTQQVRTLSETVRLDARTKLLNPKFYEGMLSTGYEGAREITKRLRNTMVRVFLFFLGGG